MIALMGLGIGFAQDARQRTVNTIVLDVLAQMPTQNQQDLDTQMTDLAKAAPQSVELLASMLQPAEARANAKVEYALSGVAAWVTAVDNAKYLDAVAEGFAHAIETTTDTVGKQFLQTQMRLLRRCGSKTLPSPPLKGGRSQRRAAGSLSDEVSTRITTFYDQAKAQGANNADAVIKALKDKERDYRVAALRTTEDWADDAFYAQVVKVYKKLTPEAQEDVINWLAEERATSQTDFVIAQIASANEDVAKAAVTAAGILGGEKSRDALFGALSNETLADVATSALTTYQGPITEQVVAALPTSEGKQQECLLTLAAARHMKQTAPTVFQMAATSDKALATLASVATPAEISQIKDAANPERYYDVLASTGTDQAVEELSAAYHGGSAKALEALKKTDNYKAAGVLYEAARKGDEEALKSHLNLIAKYNDNADSRYGYYSRVLREFDTPTAQVAALSHLGEVKNLDAFIEVGKYLDSDNADVRYTAAIAAKDVAAGCVDDIDHKMKQETLNKAIKALQEHGSADDGYVVDEIKTMLADAQPSPVYVLTDEEKKEGFELLFDGTNLDKWVGNKTGYLPVNGTIYVTAQYGNESNLYTAKEYRDFVFRFEFCFVRPGANNGVGVRTPMGVDAAYDGMCEVQILDHDDPIYASLNNYQVHGSVYGVIPAKRIVHKPLGEWETEEIIVKGDHIKVTVNGEVIVDGNIREACQGHHIAPDGSDTNPYTVDHRNHPGMFNHTGHIGFLGHGAGVKFRNVRVKELNP